MNDEEKKLEKLLAFASDPSLAMFDELQSIEENIDQITKALEGADFSSLEKFQGDQGIQGEKGEKGDKGDRGEKGEPGKPGKDGSDGIDGLDGVNGKDGEPGKPGKDGSPDTGEQLIDKINSLPIDEKYQIDAKHIKNLPKLAEKLSRDGYFRGLPQPAGAITYQLEGALVGRGNILNLKAGNNITITPLPGPGDSFTYEINSTGGGGGSDITIGNPVIGGDPNRILFIDASGNLADSQNLQFFDTTKNFRVGDIDLSGNHTEFQVNDESSTVTAYGTRLLEIIISSITFTGTGLDDFSVQTGSFQGTPPVSYTVTIDSVDTTVLTLEAVSGNYTPGEIVTGQTSGATGTVVSWVNMGIFNSLLLNPVTGTFVDGEIVDGGTSLASATISSGGINVSDTISWDDGTSSATFVAIRGGGFSQQISNFTEIIFASNTGHTLNDNWTWNYTGSATYGGMMVLDGQNHIYKFGDTSSVIDGTRFEIQTGDDITAYVNGTAGGRFVVDDTNTGNSGLSILPGSNGTNISLNDTTQDITLTSFASGDRISRITVNYAALVNYHENLITGGISQYQLDNSGASTYFTNGTTVSSAANSSSIGSSISAQLLSGDEGSSVTAGPTGVLGQYNNIPDSISNAFSLNEIGFLAAFNDGTKDVSVEIDTDSASMIYNESAPNTPLAQVIAGEMQSSMSWTDGLNVDGSAQINGAAFSISWSDQSTGVSNSYVMNDTGTTFRVENGVESAGYDIDPFKVSIMGRFEMGLGTITASANNLTLPQDGNTFFISGTTQINAITTANWNRGSRITLIFTDVLTVKHNTAGGAGTQVIKLDGGADLVTANGCVLSLIQAGASGWRQDGPATFTGA